MTHPVCTERVGLAEFAHLDRLWRLLLETGLDMRTKLETLFATEARSFGFPFAFLARVDRSTGTHRIDVGHGDHERLRPGTETPLSRTFCREALANPGTPVRVDDAVADGWADDPAFGEFGFRSYVGTTVAVDDEVYGTLGYASPDPRESPVTDRELALLELQARWVTYELHRWTGPPTGSPAGEQPDRTGASAAPGSGRSDVSGEGRPDAPAGDRDTAPTGDRGTLPACGPGGRPADRLDVMFSTLADPLRREVLLGVVDGSVERVSHVSGDAASDDDPRVLLRHVHLPKLADAGYVDWDEGVIEPGPNLAELEPLLEWLRGPSDGTPSD